MHIPKKTIEVARQLGVGHWRIRDAIRAGKIAAPARDGSGDYLWTEKDIATLKKALATDNRRRKVTA